jgi:AcrR family transcriptional regulator
VAKSTRGRRPAGSGTREAIIEVARRQFGELGFRRTTFRSIASEAGVDPRLVLHYFGSKRQLFLQSIELPLDPQLILERAFEGDPSQIATRVARLFVSALDEPRTRQAFTAIIRAAVSEPEAARLIRELLTDRVLVPFARRVGGDAPELRAGLIATQVVGIAMARHIVGIEPLARASAEQLERALAPVIDHFLHGDWPGEPDASPD